MMGNGPIGRRDFLAGAGGLFLCTLGGQKVFMNKEADLPALASDVPVPPKVLAADRNGGIQNRSQASSILARNGGQRREYWIRAEPVKWNIVPTGRDQMMAKKIKGKKTFTAFAYRAYSADFAVPLGPATIPGPLLEAEVGDTIVVNFQNKVNVPVTMHPHGIFYANEMDGAYKGKFTDPSGFVQPGRSFKYVWEANPGTAGLWHYHDHGPMDPVPVFKGLFGPMMIREPGALQADREFFLFLHGLSPVATGLRTNFSCINGRSYPGNTPTLTANVGEKVAFNVIALDNDFHTFHVHGHRWTDPDGSVIDNRTLGPADTYRIEFTEDNPGRWFYHCHVFTHLHMGMNGWYIVS